MVICFSLPKLMYFICISMLYSIITSRAAAELMLDCEDGYVQLGDTYIYNMVWMRKYYNTCLQLHVITYHYVSAEFFAFS